MAASHEKKHYEFLYTCHRRISTVKKINPILHHISNSMVTLQNCYDICM